MPRDEAKKGGFSPFLILNGLLLILCIPWMLFLVSNYAGNLSWTSFEFRAPLSLWDTLSECSKRLGPICTSHDCFSDPVNSFSFFSKFRRNAIAPFVVFVVPIGGLFLYCRLFDVSHFISSRYFVNFLPLFIITLFLSLNAIEERFERLNKFMRFKLLFIILFIASNLVILPVYYRAEKEDFRGLVNYLKGQLREGDKLFDANMAYTPGILHYFGVYPEKRHHEIPYYKVTRMRLNSGNLLFFKIDNIRFIMPGPVVTSILLTEIDYGLSEEGPRRDQKKFLLCFEGILRRKFS